MGVDPAILRWKLKTHVATLNLHTVGTSARGYVSRAVDRPRSDLLDYVWVWGGGRSWRLGRAGHVRFVRHATVSEPPAIVQAQVSTCALLRYHLPLTPDAVPKMLSYMICIFEAVIQHCDCWMFIRCFFIFFHFLFDLMHLTRQLLRYFATRDLLGGGGVKRPHVITRERMAAERQATQRSKALDETILKHPLNFPNEVTCQVKVRSKSGLSGYKL